MKNPLKNLLAAVSVLILGSLTSLAETVSITTGDGAGGDVYIKSGAENNQGDLQVKNNANDSGPRVTTKSYIKFDLSGIADSLADISSASLNLTTSFNHIGGSTGDPAATTVFVYGLTDESLDDWDELEVVWDNAPANDVTGNGWIEEAVVALGSIDVPANPDPDAVGFSSTELADFIAADTNGIVTILLRREDNNGSHNMRFFTKETGDAETMPRLDIEIEDNSTGGDSVLITTADGAGGDVYIKSGADNNQGDLQVKNNANDSGPRVTTKSYVKFDVSGVSDRLADLSSASLHLTTSFNHIGGSAGEPAATTVFVFGLTDESLDDWNELEVVWDNAPANDVTGNGWIDEAVVALGSIDVPANPDPDAVGFSSTELADFIAADTNGLVTLLLRREDNNGSHNMRFFTKETGQPETMPALDLSFAEDTGPKTFEELVGAIDLGDNQYRSSWFGGYEKSTDDWIRHEEQNWLYVGFVESTDSMWIYSLLLNRWIWTNELNFPIYYDSVDGRWIYFFSLPDEGAFLYDYSAGEWSMIGAGEPPVEGDYTILSIPVAPFIDGINGEGEWADAVNYPLTYEALVASGKGFSKLDADAGSPQPDAVRAEAQSFVGATAKGLYLGFDVTDIDLYTNPGFGVAGNGFDGVQVGIDVNPDPSDRTSTVLLDINPAATPDDTTNVYARWAIDGYMPAWGVQATSTAYEGGYFVELFVPWSFVTSFGVDNSLDAGSTYRMTIAVMDFDESGTQRELLWDSGEGALSIGNAATWPIAAIAEDLAKAPNSYSIPKVSEAPTVDGAIADGEWLYAAHTEASYENWVARSGGASKLDVDTGTTNPDAPRAEGDIFLMATDDALYMGAVIVDSSIRIENEFGTASNNMDGVQLAIDMNPDPVNRDTAVLWDFTAATMADGALTGPANIFARWGAEGYDEAWGVEAAGSFTDDGYIIEVKMPWSVMQDLGFANPLESGDIFSLGFILVDFLEDGTVVDLITDFGGGAFTVGNAETWNDATLDD